ncbi:hypothetical protein GCM10022261_11000 [Brevibacterium daeguense]|uniref:Uncharacterized protein n=1 Tax=Brevibacterium daeguense TaxID=909936 RepID=A0ABP8EHW9_9MICO|nr:monovalent cation/H+ antiporter complex subunit F [Brevibacterium daeguense]
MNGLSDELLIDPAILRIAAPILLVIFLATLVIVVIKLIRGPSILDRMIANDVFLATLLCGLGAFIAATGRVDLLPVLLAVAALGFVGSVSVSRYVSRSDTSSPVVGETRSMAQAHTLSMAQRRDQEEAQRQRSSRAGSADGPDDAEAGRPAGAETVGPLFAEEQEQS